VQIGVGLSGLIINLLRIFLLLTLPDNLSREASVFFYTSALFLVVCTILSFCFVRHYTANLSNQAQTNSG